jgi:homoserine dehydrogenase
LPWKCALRGSTGTSGGRWTFRASSARRRGPRCGAARRAEPAGSLVRACFDAGKGVVTANKLLLAKEGAVLAALAADKGVALGIEAAVAGGIPILRALRESFAGDRIVAVGGILNGTCNFILTEMATSGGRYTSILDEAQKRGYAEADPTSDVEGWDAAYKLALLARMASGGTYRSRGRPSGITALQPGCRLWKASVDTRQIALARQLLSGRLLCRSDLPRFERIALARVEGPSAVLAEGEAGALHLPFRALEDPTSTAVLSDIIRSRAKGPGRCPSVSHEELRPSGRARRVHFSASGSS